MLTPTRVVALSLLLAHSGIAQNGDALARQTLEELRSLRIELIVDILERQGEKIQMLSAELDRVRKARTRAEEALRLQQDESRSSNHQLQAAEYTLEERAQLQAAMAAAHLDSTQRLNAERRVAAERETLLAQDLNREKERASRLGQTLGSLQRLR
jgi:hypothetical protein